MHEADAIFQHERGVVNPIRSSPAELFIDIPYQLFIASRLFRLHRITHHHLSHDIPPGRCSSQRQFSAYTYNSRSSSNSSVVNKTPSSRQWTRALNILKHPQVS